MKRTIFGAWTLLASVVFGQENDEIAPTDLTQAPLIAAPAAEATANTAKEPPQIVLQHLKLPFRPEGFVLSDLDDAIFTWGQEPNQTEIKMLLLSTETGDLLAESTIDKSIRQAVVNSSDVFIETVGAGDHIKRLRRSDLRVIEKLPVTGGFELYNDSLLAVRSGEELYTLPAFKKINYAPGIEVIPSPRHERKGSTYANGFIWRGILWSHDFKPKLLLNSNAFPKLFNDESQQIATYLWCNGQILYSAIPCSGRPVRSRTAVPVVFHENGKLLFCDPTTLEILQSVPMLEGKLVGITSHRAFIERNREIYTVSVPEIPKPISLEATKTPWTLNHQVPTEFSYQCEGAVEYKMEIAGLFNQQKTILLSSKTGDFKINLHEWLPEIYEGTMRDRKPPNLRRELDESSHVFKQLIGRLPKGLPRMIQIRVAAYDKDLKTRVLSHGCIVEIPLSKFQLSNLSTAYGTDRIWRDQNEKTYTNPILRIQDKNVLLRAQDPKTPVSIPIDNLSEFDRAWLGIEEFEPKID
jgi:hypothetical protein